MTKEERRHYILNQQKYIKHYMDLHDAEVRERKVGKLKGLLKWLQK